MNRDSLHRHQGFLLFQRNIFAALALLLAVGVVALSCLLFFKRERVIVCPPVVHKQFWTDGRSIDPTYLEQFGAFMGQLLFGKSASSASSQRTDLLRHTDPTYSGLLSKRLYEEEEMLGKQNASYVFYPKLVTADPRALEVTIEGERVFFVGGERISQTAEAYTLQFKNSGGRLLLVGVQAKECNHG